MAGILDRKVALVTGGASGIGRATSLAMAREGARLAVADRTEESAAGTVAFINDRALETSRGGIGRGRAEHAIAIPDFVALIEKVPADAVLERQLARELPGVLQIVSLLKHLWLDHRVAKCQRSRSAGA